VSATGEFFVVAYTDAAVIVYDTRTGEEVVGMASHETYDGTRATAVNAVVATTAGLPDTAATAAAAATAGPGGIVGGGGGGGSGPLDAFHHQLRGGGLSSSSSSASLLADNDEAAVAAGRSAAAAAAAVPGGATGTAGSGGVEGVVITGHEDRFIRFFDANSGEGFFFLLFFPSVLFPFFPSFLFSFTLSRFLSLSLSFSFFFLSPFLLMRAKKSGVIYHL
jgi:striatin 1/3/4